MKRLVAKDGFYLTDKDKKVFFTEVFGNLDESDFIEIKKEEAEAIEQHNVLKNSIASIDDADRLSKTYNIIPEVINNFELTDEESVKRKSMYPHWEMFIEQSLKAGFKVIYNNTLYKVKQDIAVVLANQAPSIYTSSLYEEINETSSGSLEDPIPYNNNMALETGKYYIQDNVIYKCIRNTEIPVYNALISLVGIYVKVV